MAFISLLAKDNKTIFLCFLFLISQNFLNGMEEVNNQSNELYCIKSFNQRFIALVARLVHTCTVINDSFESTSATVKDSKELVDVLLYLQTKKPLGLMIHEREFMQRLLLTINLKTACWDFLRKDEQLEEVPYKDFLIICQDLECLAAEIAGFSPYIK